MVKSIMPIDESKRNIDWDEVDKKISIICRKFNNIEERHKDDLKQELLIHAYYISDDYYDLHRKAVDFWRSLQRKIYPELPFLELQDGDDTDFEDPHHVDTCMDYESSLYNIKRELTRGPYQTKSQEELDKLALKVLDVIIEDIDGSTICKETYEIYDTNKYRNGRISIMYLCKRFPDVDYKRFTNAMKRLEEVATALIAMGKITPDVNDLL